MPTTGPALAAPNLSAAYLRLEAEALPTRLTARIGNGGRLHVPRGIPVSFYDGDPRLGGTWLGTVQIAKALAPGHFEDVSLTVTGETQQTIWIAADDDGSQSSVASECDEQNNLYDSGLQLVANQPPMADAGGPYRGVEGGDLPLDGTGSSDPDGDALSFAWEIDDAGIFEDSTLANPVVRFLDEGTFTVALEVSDGTETATDTATVTITNAPPVVEAGADQTVVEGTSVSLSGASFSDSRLDTHTATVDWGDGTTIPATVTGANRTGTIAASHVYTDNGTYTVTVTVTDNDGGVGRDTLVVTVDNADPIVVAGADQSVPEGTEMTFAGSLSDPGSDTHLISWDFGDGGTATDTLSPAYRFDQNGTFIVTLTVRDDDGGVGTDTLTVTVSNVAPVVEAIADQTVVDGNELILSATVNDPGQDTQTVVIDWGDGSSDTQILPPDAGGNILAPHTYADDGVFTGTVMVTDESGGTDTQTFTITVDNVVSVVAAGVDQYADEGRPVSFTGSFMDPGTDTHSIRWDFGDSTVVTDTLNPTHTYEQDGVFTVTLTVTDDDGGVGTDSLTVAVANLSPVVDTIPDQTVADGSEFVLTATFHDPGHDTQTVVIDWGDGSPIEHQTIHPEMGGNITATHLYPDDGVFTVTVAVTDESGGTDPQTFAVTVANVIPVAEAGEDITATEGEVVSYTGSFTDPGTDSHRIRWDFGDGTIVTNTLTPKHPYEQDGVFTATLTVTDDDGGVGTDTIIVTVKNAAPVVDIGVDKAVSEGHMIRFEGRVSDVPTDTHSVTWDFGDGSTTTGTLTPTHVYAAPGVYPVTLTVSDQDGGVSQHTLNVTIEAAIRLSVLPNRLSHFEKGGGEHPVLTLSVTSDVGNMGLRSLRLQTDGLLDTSTDVKGATLYLDHNHNGKAEPAERLASGRLEANGVLHFHFEAPLRVNPGESFLMVTYQF